MASPQMDWFIGIKCSNAVLTWYDLIIMVSCDHGATSSSTVTLRKNNANASNTFSINANTTGAFSDTTPHNDSIATGDLIAVESWSRIFCTHY